MVVAVVVLILDFLNSASFSVAAHLDNLRTSQRIIFRQASQFLILLLCNLSILKIESKPDFNSEPMAVPEQGQGTMQKALFFLKLD